MVRVTVPDIEISFPIYVVVSCRSLRRVNTRKRRVLQQVRNVVEGHVELLSLSEVGVVLLHERSGSALEVRLEPAGGSRE